MNTETKEIVVASLPPAERAHHPYSPSTLQYLEACPLYLGKQSAKPHPRTVIGTLSHGVVETGEDNEELGDDDMEFVTMCIDFYEQRKQIFAEARARAAAMSNDPTPEIIELKETYLPVDNEAFADGAVGTTAGYIDCCIISHDQIYAEMFDWKFGVWQVEAAENNLQGIAYVLGLFRKYPTLQKIKFYFKQPVIDSISDHTWTREEVAALYLRVQVVVAKARHARALRLADPRDFSAAAPHIPACNFCSHIGICPKVTAFACNVGAKFFPMEIPSSITPTEVHNEADTKIGLRLASVMEVWAKAYKSTVTDRVLRRDAVCPEGFTIQSRAPRKIVDHNKYKTVALRYLTEHEYEETLKASFGAVEDKIKDKAPRGQKTAAVQEFGEALIECGAVERGNSFSFLRAVNSKKEAAEA